jgi:biopolymer transport protein ExbD
MSPLDPGNLAGELSGDDEGNWLAEINTTPLVDVMLVLLIVFMVTMPVLTHTLEVELPRASATPQRPAAQRLTVAIDRQGALSLDGQPLSRDHLRGRLADAQARDADTELHIAADRSVAFEQVTDTMALASAVGLTRIGFVTEPRR